MERKFSKKADIIQELSTKQQKELEKLAAEPDEKNTMTLGEFNKATNIWRSDKDGMIH